MSLLADLKTISHLALTPRDGATHKQRLENFYAGQANDYDEFRKKLLHGREQTIAYLDLPDAAKVADIGGGTGANLDALNDFQKEKIDSWLLLDLCPSLLEVARRKMRDKNWDFAQAIQGDACFWQPPEAVDLVLFSYSATMIPDWLTAFENAYEMLKPGGQIAVVDFYVARKFPQSTKSHSSFTRHFWPVWFSWDNVFLNADHLPWLQHRYETVYLEESAAPLPYLPFTRVPYYIFIGEKTG